MKGSFFEKTSKMDKSLARLIKEHSERIQIKKIRNEEEKLQLRPQKYSRAEVTTTSSTMPATKWATWKKWTNLLRGTTFQDRMRKKQKIQTEQSQVMETETAI